MSDIIIGYLVEINLQEGPLHVGVQFIISKFVSNHLVEHSYHFLKHFTMYYLNVNNP